MIGSVISSMQMRADHLEGANTVEQELRKVIKHIDFAMLTTWDGSEMKSRPMSTLQVDTSGELWFFTQKSSEKVDDIEEYDKVNVAYSDPHHKLFLSVAGRARILVDRAKARELWTPEAGIWFDGPDDPSLALVCVTVDSADYWNSKGEMIEVDGLLRAAVMGHPYPPGDSVETTVSQAQLSEGERRI